MRIFTTRINAAVSNHLDANLWGRYNAYVSLTENMKLSHTGALKVLSMTVYELNDLIKRFGHSSFSLNERINN